LSDDQRWDVLAYVHARFHHGFKSEGLVAAEGKVIAVVPTSQQIVVEHGEIKGFMGAMTMGYKVNPPSLLHNGFQAGDTIRFTIDKQQQAIVKIEKLQP
jgi:Cu/Ag efflux protein CusF